MSAASVTQMPLPGVPAPAKRQAKARSAPAPRKPRGPYVTKRKLAEQAAAKTRNYLTAAIAAGGASFLPSATWQLGHVETTDRPLMWILVGAALLFSLPSVLSWAKTWCGSTVKAFGFAVLLEGCLTFAHTPWLSYGALAILVAANGAAAWQKASGK